MACGTSCNCSSCTTSCNSSKPRYCGPDLSVIGATSGSTLDTVIQNIENYLDSGATPSVLTDNGDGTYTHNDGNGVIVTITAGTGNTSVLTDNGDGTYTHNDGTGNTVAIDTRDLISDWVANTAYVLNQEVTAVSPSTGHRTLYRRTAAGTSGGTFDTTEEPLWTAISTVGRDRLFADDTTVAPATAGAPTNAEIAAFAATSLLADGLVYYTGDDTSTNAETYVFWVDASGVATTIEKPDSTGSHAEDLVLAADVTDTVTHNLGTTDIVVQVKDSTGELVHVDHINNYTANTVDLTASVADTYRVMVIAI